MSQQINLYEERLRPRLELATGRNLGIAALVLLAVMAGWSLWTGAEANRRSEAAAASLKEVLAAQETMKVLTQTVAQRKVSPELATEVEGAKSTIAARQEVIEVLDSGALGRTSGFSPFMAGFAQQAQSDLWLTGFRITAGGDEIEIRGRMLDPSSLPGYVQRLNTVPAFQGRRFAALEMQRVDPEPLPEGSPAAVSSTLPATVPFTQGAQDPRPQRPLPFVEFLLRSENAGGGDASARAREAS